MVATALVFVFSIDSCAITLVKSVVFLVSEGGASWNVSHRIGYLCIGGLLDMT